MGTTRDRMGGLRLWNEGELLTYDSVNDMGGIGLQTLMHLMAELFWDEVADEPRTGFIGNGCKVDSPGLSGTDPKVTLNPGLGFYYDAAETDEFGAHYKPIVVDAALDIVLDPHDGTFARWDIVCLKPDTADDETSTRTIKDVSTGNVAAQSVSTRRRLTYAHTVVTGTPTTSPSVPATPSGYIKVAEVLVPAILGPPSDNVDTRPILHIASKVRADVPEDYHQNWVPTGLQVNAASPTSNDVVVDTGLAVIQGKRLRYLEQEVGPFSTAHATLDRIDLVYAASDGTLGITDGTPDASPVAPALQPDQVALAEVLIHAGVGTPSIATADITDRRIFYPLGSDQLDDGAVEERNITSAAVTTDKIDDLAVTTAKVNDLAVTTAKVNDSAVTIDKVSSEILRMAEVEIPAADVKQLFTTPYTVVSVPVVVGTDKYAAFVSATLWLDHDGGADYDAPASLNDLVFAFDGGDEVSSEVETSGFIDASADAVRHAVARGDASSVAASYTPLKETNIVLKAKAADFTGTGVTSPLKVRVYYRLVDYTW